MIELFGNSGFIVAFRILPIIIFFASLIAVLYYLGIMPLIIKILGGALQKLLGTSRAESMSTTANIFVGSTESPLVVKPFLAKMTQSELFAVMCGGLASIAVMCGGLASIAGTVLASLTTMGMPLEHLIAASFMAAPAGILFAKIIKPETEQSVEQFNFDKEEQNVDRPVNIIDAAVTGAITGMNLALTVGAMLIAFIALIAMINGIIGGVGLWFGMPDITLELIFGYIFSPIAFLIGVPWNEAHIAGTFIGQKVIINEFFAYMNLVPYFQDLAHGGIIVEQTGLPMTEKTKIILTFALCGFANLSGLAVLLGGLTRLVPERHHDIARFGIRVLVAATLSNLMSACIAGLFFSL